MAARKYEVGQRWKLKAVVPGFESTILIAQVCHPHPEWGPAVTQYSGYVRFDPGSGVWTPPGLDGVKLLLEEEHLTEGVTRLVERDVKVPWWWIHGRKYKKRSDAPNTTHFTSYGRIEDGLKREIEQAIARNKYDQQRIDAIKQHQLLYPTDRKRAKKSKTVAESWERIVAALMRQSCNFRLNAGASVKAIAAFEKEIGSKLPDDFKDSLLLHDGGSSGLPPNYGDFLTMEQMLEQWRRYREAQQQGHYAIAGSDDWRADEVKGPVKPVFWNTKRIYVSDNSGDHLTLDLDPPKGGKYGQVLEHSHEVGPLKVVARSWSEFLGQLAVDLESGKYVYFPEEGSIEPFDNHLGPWMN